MLVALVWLLLVFVFVFAGLPRERVEILPALVLLLTPWDLAEVGLVFLLPLPFCRDWPSHPNPQTLTCLLDPTCRACPSSFYRVVQVVAGVVHVGVLVIVLGHHLVLPARQWKFRPKE